MNTTMLVRDLELVVEACRDIERGHADPPSLADLAANAGLSRFHFHRLFKQVMKITPHSYLASSRARRVRAELARTVTVTDAFYNAGFGSNGRFYEAAPDILGMTPTRFRAGGEGEMIEYCFEQGPDGGVTLVSFASKGLCDVIFAETPESAVGMLKSTFPRAIFTAGSGACTEKEYRAWLSAGRSVVCPELPPDIRETVMARLIRDKFREVVPRR